MKKLFLIACTTFGLLTANSVQAQQFNNTALAAKATIFTQEIEAGCWTPPQGYIDGNAIMLARVEIKPEPYQANEPYIRLSTIGLRNKCNPNMQRDEANFDPNNFNPLKYFLMFKDGATTTYRVDNTNYVIVIHP